MALKHLFFALFAFCSLQKGLAQNTHEQTLAMAKVTMTISGMACQEGCADTIAKNLQNLKGVTEASVSYETGKAVIVYDSGALSLEILEKTITDTKVKDYVYTVVGRHFANNQPEKQK